MLLRTSPRQLRALFLCTSVPRLSVHSFVHIFILINSKGIFKKFLYRKLFHWFILMKGIQTVTWETKGKSQVFYGDRNGIVSEDFLGSLEPPASPWGALLTPPCCFP